MGAAIQERVGPSFPVGTLVINITGSLLLGFLVRVALDTPAVTLPMRAFLTTGLCGGFTTFSTFSYETAGLIDERAYGRAAIYILASVALGLVGMFAGFRTARWALSAIRAL
jgi:CrcB protein